MQENRNKNSNMALTNRVLILELFKDSTEKELNEIKKETKILEKGLKQIDDTIKSVKNWIMGGVVMLFVQQIGFVEVIKKLFF